MCRFLAYRGEPILIETLVCTPCHSLIHQSMHAVEGKTEINGDGFGIGWYGERAEPGTYRELRPAWSDENLRSLCAQVRSPLFFAHVRAATGTATTRANCHPFSAGRFLFMHNGQVGSFAGVRRRIEALIPDEFYQERAGTTDSEAMFLAALGMGAAEDPVAGVSRMLRTADASMRKAGIGAALRFTAALTDGRNLWAFRWASDGHAPTLYFRHRANGLVVVSEPIDENRPDWQEVPQAHCLIATDDGVRIEKMQMELAEAA
jgi:predicted glutamine amidotransferase